MEFENDRVPVAMRWVASDTGIQASDERRGGDGELIRPETKKAANPPVIEIHRISLERAICTR